MRVHPPQGMQIRPLTWSVWGNPFSSPPAPRAPRRDRILDEQHPKPKACPRGAQRAVTAFQLFDLYDFFQAARAWPNGSGGRGVGPVVHAPGGRYKYVPVRWFLLEVLLLGRHPALGILHGEHVGWAN